MFPVSPTPLPVVPLFQSCRFHTPVTLLALLLSLLFGADLRADESASNYDQATVAAKALAAAGSWDEAYVAFVAARQLTTDEAASRWCDLWIRNAAWHSRRHSYGPEMGMRAMDVYFSAQFQPYEQGRPRDEFWLSLKSCRAEFMPQHESPAGESYFKGFSHRSSSAERTETRVSWNDLLDMADYLSGLPATPENTQRYIACLQRTVNQLGIVNLSSAGDRMRTHLANACSVKADPNDTAWCLLAHARSMGEDARLSLAQRDQYWSRAREASAGTPWDRKARAAYAIWQARRINDHDQPPVDRKSRAESLAELKALAPTAPNDEGEIFSGDPYTITRIIRDLSQPTLQLSIAPILAPDQTVAINFAAANLASVHATLSRLPPLDSKSQAKTTSEAVPVVIRHWEIALQESRSGAWNTGTVEVAPQLPPGEYQISLDGGQSTLPNRPLQPFSETVHFTVSDLTATVFNSGLGSSEVFVSRRSTGKPITNATVRCWTAYRNAPPGFYKLRTDVHGRVLVPASENTGHNLVSDDEQVALLIEDEPLNFNRPLALASPGLQFELITDKASYQPGEVLRWHILTLSFRDGRFLPPEFPVYLTAYLNGEALLKNESLLFSQSYLTHGRLTIPAHAKPGEVIFFISRSPETADKELVWRSDDLRVTSAPQSGSFQGKPTPVAQSLPNPAVAAAGSLSPNRTTLEQHATAAYVSGPAFLESGKPFSVTVTLPKGETECWLSLLGDQEVTTRKIKTSDRTAQVVFKRAPHMNAFGSLVLFGVHDPKSPYYCSDIPAKTSNLPAPVIEIDRVVKELGDNFHHSFYMDWYTLPRTPEDTPDDEMAGIGLGRNRMMNFPSFLTQRRLAEPVQEFSRWISVLSYLNAMGCRWDVPSLDAELVQTMDAPAAVRLFPDERIKPVLVGEKHGYCPEEVSFTGLTPF